MAYIITDIGQYIQFDNGAYMTIPIGPVGPIDISALLNDGSTFGWYVGDAESTFTKDASGYLTVWADYLGSGNNLAYYSAYPTSTPLWTSNGIVTFTADSSTELRIYNEFHNPPITWYMVVDYKEWVTNKRLAAGYTGGGRLWTGSAGDNPDLFIESIGPITDLSTNTFGIITVVWDGANSLIQVNNGTPATGDTGTPNMLGLMLGQRGSHAVYDNLAFKEFIVRDVADNEAARTLVYDYLWNKYFVPAAGGFGITHLQNIDVSLYDTSVNVSVPLSGFTDLSKMVAFVSYEIFNTQPLNMPNAYSQLDACVNSTSEVILQRGNTAAGFGINATVNVIQFSSGTTVYKGAWSMGTTDSSIDVSIGGIITDTSSFVFHHIQSSNLAYSQDGAPRDRAVSSRFLNSSNLNFYRGATDDASVSGHWYVVTHPDVSVHHGSFSKVDDPDTTTHPIGFVVDTSTTFLLASTDTTETPFNQEGMWRLSIGPSNSDIIAESFYTGGATVMHIHYQLIHHPDLAVERIQLRATSANTSYAITPIDLSTSIAIPTVRSGYSLQPRYEGTYFNHMFCRYHLDTSTNVISSVDYPLGDTQDTAFQVIQFPSTLD